MNIWFMVWVFVAVVIMGTFFWSVRILLRQKMAWKAFAKSHNLTFDQRGITMSAVVSGDMRGVPLTISSDPQVDEDYRGRRFMTTIQLDMHFAMPTDGVIGSPGLRRFVNSLALPEEFVPSKNSGWNDKAMIKAQEAEKLDAYFTRERTQAINSLMLIKGVNVLIVFNAREMLLRFETPDPMDDAERLSRLVNKIIDVSEVLKV